MDDPDQFHLEVLNPPNDCAGLPAALLALLFTAGCATFGPPVSFSDDHQSRQRSSASRSLSVRPVEGRPDGLVLELVIDFEPQPGSRLVVRRHLDDGDPRTLRTIELDAERARRARKEGIEFIDRSVESGSELHYRIAYFAPRRSSGDADRPDRRSEPLTVEWSSPPPRPERLTARADTPRAVELRWEPGETGALIFRRDVLRRSTNTQRIATLRAGERGVLLDRDVRSGGVYAYRVALAHEHLSYTQYGPPSEAVYISVPER